MIVSGRNLVKDFLIRRAFLMVGELSEKGRKINPSTTRSEARGYDFGVSSVERSGLILSGALNPDLKIGVWRRRTYLALFTPTPFFSSMDKNISTKSSPQRGTFPEETLRLGAIKAKGKNRERINGGV